MTTSSALRPIRVWDLPTRVFHVLLITAVSGLIITGEIGGSLMKFHYWFGYGVLSLLFFRVIWGIWGGHWSRFVNFLPTPSKVRAYLADSRQGVQRVSIGHNPLGALSVFAMLVVLSLQVFSGLMSDDEISNAGPWASLVSSTWVSFATNFHTEIGKVILISILVLHLVSVLYYKYFKHEDLLTPMVNGDKHLPSDTPGSRDSTTSRLFALGVWLGCAYAVYKLVNLA
ncbi:cytochrome b/b6 domain-containing protein [Limnohabitans sp.]|uniref:cytochrome b/b6 domain-containing protein n=1 Tax=Limnohabitans sp. TaxID=1907725 RepID=UPI003341FF48